MSNGYGGGGEKTAFEQKHGEYHGKVWGGDDGRPLVVKDVDFTFDEESGDVAAVVLRADVASRLLDPFNLKAGAEPVEVREITLQVNVKKDQNPHITVGAINRAFGLSGDRALDHTDPEWFTALMGEAGDGDNVLGDVVGKPSKLYARSSVSPGKAKDEQGRPTDGSVFYNPFVPKETVSAKDAKERYLKRKKELDAF